MRPRARSARAGFLPTLEKFGKTVQVLLGEDEVHMVQGPVNTDGPSVMCRFGMVCRGAGHGMVGMVTRWHGKSMRQMHVL
jgi:hypothetical protein